MMKWMIMETIIIAISGLIPPPPTLLLMSNANMIGEDEYEDKAITYEGMMPPFNVEGRVVDVERLDTWIDQLET